jgi:uncharacterized protein
MTEQNKQVALRFIEAMSAGDAATAATCLAPDAFTQAKGYGKFAGPRGYETIMAMIESLNQFAPGGLRPTIHTVTAEGERVAVEFEGDATLSNGERYCNQYCMVFTVRDGRIRQVNEYFCTLLADKVLWPLVEKAAP